MAFNLNICHILDVGSPLAIFHHLCHSPRGVAISRHFCQILPVSLKSPPSKGPLLASNLSHRPSGDFSPLHAFLDRSVLMTVLLFFMKQQEIHRVNKLSDVAFSFMHDTCQNVDQSEGRLVLELDQAKYILESLLLLPKQKKLQCFE